MWFLPSRGRPAACQAVLDQMVAHGMCGAGIVAIDGDDPELLAYQHLRYPEDWVHWVLPPGAPGLGRALRAVFRDLPDEPWYGLIADDNRVETDGFDQLLVDAAGAWCIASANDLWQAPKRMHGVTVFGGDLLRALGYWSPQGFDHLYIDDVFETIGRALENWRVLMDVVTPHDHPMKTSAVMDETHTRVNAADVVNHDRERFRVWLRDEMAVDVLRARLAMQGLSLARATERSVMLAFPVYDKPHWQHEAAAMETVGLLSQLGIRHGFAHVPGLPIAMARNMLVGAFLASEFTNLLFIDADMAWKPADVVRLLASPYPLIGGVGRKRNDVPPTDGTAWCCKPLDVDGARDAAGAFECEHLGTGFMLINRCVFDAMTPAVVSAINGEKVGQYFHHTFRNGEVLSEDYAFCHDFRAIGGHVMADPTIELSHFGTSEHKARLVDYISGS